MTTLPEERVLQPLNPLPEDVNEWPDFALRDVKIFYQGKGRYADLLDADPEIPLCVLGELMPLDDEQEHLALIENPLYARMKIENVTNYSFGQSDDGKPVIWAAGKAGWYEISPSDRYLSHYNDTIEAIDLFYFMVDQFRKLSPKRKRLGFQIDPFLREYQKHTDYRVDDDDEAMEILHKHHKFILKQMIEEREEIDWSQTHLWNHLAETYSEEIEELRSKLTPVIEVEEATESSSSSEESESDESSVDETDWTKPIWVILNVLRKSPAFDIKHAGIDDVAREVEKMPDFTGNHKAAVGALERSAEPLLRLMNEAKLRKKFNWSTRAIYAELEATLADEIAEEIRTPAPKTSNKKHRLKSVLRPSGAGLGSKRTKETEDDEDDEEMQDNPPITSPVARKVRSESAMSRMDSPSRQLNGHYDPHGLPELPPAPEAQEMMDLVQVEAKKVGRVNQVHHLQAFLGHYSEF